MCEIVINEFLDPACGHKIMVRKKCENGSEGFCSRQRDIKTTRITHETGKCYICLGLSEESNRERARLLETTRVIEAEQAQAEIDAIAKNRSRVKDSINDDELQDRLESNARILSKLGELEKENEERVKRKASHEIEKEKPEVVSKELARAREEMRQRLQKERDYDLARKAIMRTLSLIPDQSPDDSDQDDEEDEADEEDEDNDSTDQLPSKEWIENDDMDSSSFQPTNGFPVEVVEQAERSAALNAGSRIRAGGKVDALDQEEDDVANTVRDLLYFLNDNFDEEDMDLTPNFLDELAEHVGLDSDTTIDALQQLVMIKIERSRLQHIGRSQERTKSGHSGCKEQQAPQEPNGLSEHLLVNNSTPKVNLNFFDINDSSSNGTVKSKAGEKAMGDLILEFIAKYSGNTGGRNNTKNASPKWKGKVVLR